MRVLIISDTHGRHTAFDRAIMEAGKIDYLVHLGDTEGGEDYIEAFCGCPAYILAGNNDFFSRNLREMEIYFGKKKAFMAHGHQYSVSLGVERILDEGRSRNADIVMFGHTHRPHEFFNDRTQCTGSGILLHCLSCDRMKCTIIEFQINLIQCQKLLILHKDRIFRKR